MSIELTKERIAVMQAYVDGKPIEASAHSKDMWRRCYAPGWDWDRFDYRIAVTKPSIDWTHVSQTYRWLATDGNGLAWLLEGTPTLSSTSWTGGARITSAEHFASFRPGTCDWKDSLVERPEGPWAYDA